MLLMNRWEGIQKLESLSKSENVEYCSLPKIHRRILRFFFKYMENVPDQCIKVPIRFLIMVLFKDIEF